MVLKKGFSTKEWRRALEAAQQILEPQDEEECWWDVYIQEILPRLSPNQLQKLKSVCQNWNRTISTPDFALLHLKIYNNQTRIRVLIPRCYGVLEYKINGDEETELQIHYPPAILTNPSREPIILGSCDGLLCLLLHAETATPPKTHSVAAYNPSSKGTRRKNHSIAVYNPSTGKHFCLQSPLKQDYYIDCSWFGYIDCSWFGHHPSSGEYILVLGNFNDEIGVYEFNNRRCNLKKIHSTSCCINTLWNCEDRFGTLLHGALHWPALRREDRSHVICAYHLDDNKYFEFSPPVQRGFKLGVAEGCLFAFFKADYWTCVFELWILKEYKLQQSWTRCANVEAEGFDHSRLLFSPVGRKVFSPVGFIPNGNLILYPNKLGFINYTFNDKVGLLKYTFNGNQALLLVHHPYCRSETIICADSLVSPEIVGTSAE